MFKLLTLSLILALTAAAQTTTRRPFVRASGEGIISVRPDQVKVTVTVTMTGSTAQEATEATANQVANVLSALRTLLGANGDIRTLGISVTPQYRYPAGGPQQLVGYQASNTIQVTLNDLTLAGRTIDTAVQAGATSIGGLSFQLKDSAPVRNQALREATQQARSRAEAIATGLGMRVGAIVMAAEGSTSAVIPYTVDGRAATTAPTTQVEPGAVQVHAYVTIEAELNP
jgi:uncharacterized protein